MPAKSSPRREFGTLYRATVGPLQRYLRRLLGNASEAEDIAQRIDNRMRAYEMVLRGMSGLVVGSSSVSAEEWARATDQLQLQERYPGIQALAWARYLRHEELNEFVGEIWDQGRREFRVFPAEPREEYLVVQYSSPLDWRNRRTLGFDMLSEAVRTGKYRLSDIPQAHMPSTPIPIHAAAC